MTSSTCIAQARLVCNKQLTTSSIYSSGVQVRHNCLVHATTYRCTVRTCVLHRLVHEYKQTLVTANCTEYIANMSLHYFVSTKNLEKNYMHSMQYTRRRTRTSKLLRLRLMSRDMTEHSLHDRTLPIRQNTSCTTKHFLHLHDSTPIPTRVSFV